VVDGRVGFTGFDKLEEMIGTMADDEEDDETVEG
jgi:hypothetical protein